MMINKVRLIRRIVEARDKFKKECTDKNANYCIWTYEGFNKALDIIASYRERKESVKKWVVFIEKKQYQRVHYVINLFIIFKE